MKAIEHKVAEVAIERQREGKATPLVRLHVQDFWGIARRLSAKVDVDPNGCEWMTLHTQAGAVRVESHKHTPYRMVEVVELEERATDGKDQANPPG